MIFRYLMLLVASLFLTAPTASYAQEQLNAAQIETLLSGNSIYGTWYGDPYVQYFDPTGPTLYKPENGHSDGGSWRVNHETNEYESWWRMSGWSSYKVAKTEDGYAWMHHSTLQPFTVTEGDKTR